MSTVVQFKRPTKPRKNARHIPEIGDLYVEIGPNGLWKVVNIYTVGPNKSGRWPKIIRNIEFVRIQHSKRELSYDGRHGKNHIAEKRCLREQTFLRCFETITEHKRSMDDILQKLPECAQAFFDINGIERYF